MIWRFDYSRRALAWLLGLSFVLGTVLELREQWYSRSAASNARIVYMGKNHEVLRAADSIHAARVALLNRPININTANEIELERLPGIGPVLAARIIEERETGGPFISADDLERVPGIGEKKIAAMRDRVITSE